MRVNLDSDKCVYELLFFPPAGKSIGVTSVNFAGMTNLLSPLQVHDNGIHEEETWKLETVRQLRGVVSTSEINRKL